MEDAYHILFEKSYQNNPLFKNQLDLVNTLLNDAETKYYTESNDKEIYNKHQTRLKTLISQLLSPNVSRIIPETLKDGLEIIIDKKIKDPKLTKEIVAEIVEDLKYKNIIGSKHDNKQGLIEHFKSDFKNSNYVAIVTCNPLEIEAELNFDAFSIRQVFIQDFLENLGSERILIKKYRFLFPMEPSCMLFWKGLREIVFIYLKGKRTDKSFIKDLILKFNSTTPDTINDEYLHKLTSELLIYLNTQGLLYIFWHTAPIFSLPLIALNPAEFKNSKVYTFLDNDEPEPSLHKYSSEETILWRFFVWDKLKTKQYAGQKIDFTDCF